MSEGRQNVRDQLTDMQALAATLFGECRGESILGQIAVANVVRNRTIHTLVPKTIRSVCLARLQFSCWWTSDTNSDLVYLVATAMIGGVAPPIQSYDMVAFKQVSWVAMGILSGDIHEDPTHGAVNYLEKSLYAAKPEVLGPVASVLAEIGSHVFLKLA